MQRTGDAPLPVKHATEARSPDIGEETLAFADNCDDQSTQWYSLAPRDEVGIVTCFERTDEEDVRDHTARLIRRSSPTRGTVLDLPRKSL